MTWNEPILILQEENDSKWITEEFDSSSNSSSSVNIQDNVIATTWKDGPYLLVVKIVSSKQDANWNLTGEIIFFTDNHVHIKYGV